MQHYGNGGDAHPMLQEKKRKKKHTFFTCEIWGGGYTDDCVGQNRATYADRKYRANFIHRIAVSSCTDIGIL